MTYFFAVTLWTVRWLVVIDWPNINESQVTAIRSRIESVAAKYDCLCASLGVQAVLVHDHLAVAHVCCISVELLFGFRGFRLKIENTARIRAVVVGNEILKALEMSF